MISEVLGAGPVRARQSIEYVVKSTASPESDPGGCETRREPVSKTERTIEYLSILKRALNAVSRRPGRFQAKEKAARGLPFQFEDAKVGLLVPSSWFFPGPPSSRLASRFQTRICSCIGLPGIALSGSFPSSPARSHCSVDPLALFAFPTGSAFASTAPDY